MNLETGLVVRMMLLFHGRSERIDLLVLQNTLTIDQTGSENTQELDTNNLDLKLLFENKQNYDNTLPIKLYFKEKKITDDLYQDILFIKD
jgi:hypothetical protein